ncbi:MAG: hypothetical protein IKU36_11225 [Bacteroidales bacterium]|nr:hypothetical protein [Bacteroidales bacterium]
MKKFIFIVALFLVAFSASAQYAVMEGQQLSVSFGRVYADGVKLTDAQADALFAQLDGIDGISRLKDYTYYRDKYKTGAWLTAGGTVSAFAGYFMSIFGVIMALSEPVGVPENEYSSSSVNSIGNGLLIGGTVMFYSGIGCSIAGISMLGRNNSQLKSLARTYNAFSRTNSLSRTDYVEFSFGPTASGVGLALNF